MIIMMAMFETANQVTKEPWPSLYGASRLFDWASFVLIGSLVIGAAATVVIVWMGIVKEHHWDLARESAAKKTAELNNETERLKGDNLALQAVLLPRHAGLIGIDREPPAKKWFAGFERWTGIKVLIQVVPGDPEAQNLANEIAIVLSKFGWVPEMIGEKRSGINLNMQEGLSVYSPGIDRPWDPTDPTEQFLTKLHDAAASLAEALTRAGLGVGPYPVAGTHGLIIDITDLPSDSDAAKHRYGRFNPQLDGVYLQVGSRPVSRTLQWIAAGRPDISGKPATVPTLKQ